MSGEHVGVLIGVVRRLDDGQHEGRVEVDFPTFATPLPSFWAAVASPMAGNDRGFRFAPQPGDECLVAFDRGDPDHPYVIGFLHNGVDRTPAANPAERIIASVNGHLILFDDTADGDGGKGRLTVRDAHGNTIEMNNATVSVKAKGHLDIDAPLLSLNGRPVARGSGLI
jgi:uncharacterized protein involved in type VI secretion and phage assembly